jgi:hypothetical protein
VADARLRGHPVADRLPRPPPGHRRVRCGRRDRDAPEPCCAALAALALPGANVDGNRCGGRRGNVRALAGPARGAAVAPRARAPPGWLAARPGGPARCCPCRVRRRGRERRVRAPSRRARADPVLGHRERLATDRLRGVHRAGLCCDARLRCGRPAGAGHGPPDGARSRVGRPRRAPALGWVAARDQHGRGAAGAAHRGGAGGSGCPVSRGARRSGRAAPWRGGGNTRHTLLVAGGTCHRTRARPVHTTHAAYAGTVDSAGPLPRRRAPVDEARVPEPIRIGLPALKGRLRLPRLRKVAPRSASEAYRGALAALRTTEARRDAGETPREHAARLGSMPFTSRAVRRDVASLAADYQLDVFAGRELSRREEARALARWRRIVRATRRRSSRKEPDTPA